MPARGDLAGVVGRLALCGSALAGAFSTHGAGNDAMPPLVPERVEVVVPASSTGQVVVRQFAVRVETKKPDARLALRVVDGVRSAWLSIPASQRTVRVASPSTQVFDLSIDTRSLGPEGGRAEIEILGARPGSTVLRLPVSVSMYGTERSSRDAAGVRPVVAATPGRTTRRDAEEGGETDGSEADKASSAISDFVFGSVEPRTIRFVVENGGVQPPDAEITVTFPVDLRIESPVVSYRAQVGSLAAGENAASPGPIEEIERPPAPWLILEPRGDLTGLQGERASHRIRIDPTKLETGYYNTMVVFEGLSPAPLLVLVAVEVRP